MQLFENLAMVSIHYEVNNTIMKNQDQPEKHEIKDKKYLRKSMISSDDRLQPTDHFMLSHLSLSIFRKSFLNEIMN